MRDALANVPRAQTTVVATAIRPVFVQPDQESATRAWRHVADQARSRRPKLSGSMDDAEADVLAYMAFPTRHRTKLHSTNPLERLDKDVKRRADVVGIFPSEASITATRAVAAAPRPRSRSAVGAVLVKQTEEWQLQHRWMRIEGMGELDADPPEIEDDTTPQITLPNTPKAA